jgi:hypothetical protein
LVRGPALLRPGHLTGAIARRYRLESHSVFPPRAFLSSVVPPHALPHGGDETGARDMIKQRLLVLAAALGAALIANVAQAGQCPAGEIRAGATKPVTTPPRE